MKEQSISDYLSIPGRTQVKLAEMLGITQSAIHQMIKSGRQIIIREHPDGRVTAYEARPVPAKRQTAA